MSASGPVDPAIYLAEGEALFEAAVQRAAFYRKLTGALLIVGAFATFGLHLGWALSTGQTDLLEPKTFLGGEVINLAALAYGAFLIFAVKAPSERAWAAYINDKNLQRPLVSIRPLVVVSPGAAIAGVQGSF